MGSKKVTPPKRQYPEKTTKTTKTAKTAKTTKTTKTTRDKSTSWLPHRWQLPQTGLEMANYAQECSPRHVFCMIFREESKYGFDKIQFFIGKKLKKLSHPLIKIKFCRTQI